MQKRSRLADITSRRLPAAISLGRWSLVVLQAGERMESYSVLATLCARATLYAGLSVRARFERACRHAYNNEKEMSCNDKTAR